MCQQLGFTPWGTKSHILIHRRSLLQYHSTLLKKIGTKRFVLSVISGSSHVVAHMIVTGGLHDL